MTDPSRLIPLSVNSSLRQKPACWMLAGVSLLVLSTSTQAVFADDAPVQVPAIDVTGQQTGAADDREDSAANGYRAKTQSVTPLGKMKLEDTPYSINVTSGELMDNLHAHTVADALRENPTAVPLIIPNSVNSLSRMMIRGFNASDQNEMRDGVVDRSFTFPPLENVDRIEVLNGMSSFLLGFSAPGGAVNYVSKKPTQSPLYSVETGVYGGGIDYAHADLGGPIVGTDSKMGYRLNAYRENGSTFVDGSNQRRTLMSGVVDYHLAPDTVARVDLWHQDYVAQGLQTYFANTSSGTWNTSTFGVPSASMFKATKQYGQDWSFNKSDKTLGGLALESKLNDIFSLRTAYRHGEMWRQDSYIDAQMLNSSGSYSEKLTAEPTQYEHTNQGYSLVDMDVDTWRLHHTFTAGVTTAEYYYKRASSYTATLGTTNIDSTTTFAQPGSSFSQNNNFQDVTMVSTLLGDHITLENWSLVLGVNHAKLMQGAWGAGTTISTSNYVAERNTPTYALIYKPSPDISTYVSYIEGLTAGDSTSSATAINRYQVLAPSVSKQYETGVKSTVGNMDLNAALFRIDKVNAELAPDNYYKQDGREIHQGLEFTASGKLTPRLTLVGGFTVMDAFLSKASADRKSEGMIPVNVPEKQGRAYLEYALPWVPDLTLTGGADYYGKRPVDTYNTGFLPDATIFNAGLRYEPEIYGHKTNFNLTVSNLLDTAYWAYYRSGDGMILGAPRVVSLSLKTTW